MIASSGSSVIGRNTEFAIALRARHATLEKGALVDDIEPLCGMGRQTDREPGQRKPLPTRAAELGIGDPGRLSPLRAQCLEFDVARQQCVDRTDAEGFDAQFLAAIADPAFPWKAPVPEPLHMEHDFAADLLRLASRIGGSGRRAIRTGPIEPPHVDIGYGDGLRRKTVGGDEYMCATRRRLDDDRATLPVEPAVAASGSADDLSTPFSLIPQRGDVHRGHLETGHLAEHAEALADFEGVKTLLERHDIGHRGRLIGSPERHSPASRRSARSGWP